MSICFVGYLEITDLHSLAHFGEACLKLLYDAHLQVEADGQVGVLVGRVDGTADEEVDIGRLLEEKAADERRAVLFEGPMLKELVVAHVVLGVFYHSVHGNDTLGHKVDSVDIGNWRNVAVFNYFAHSYRLSQVFCHDGGGGAARDDVLSRL